MENRLGLTDKLSLLTGLRYDAIDLDVTNHRSITATNPRHFKRSWEPVTGRVGLTYQFIPSANVYVQYSTAAEQPSTTTQVFDVSTGKQDKAYQCQPGEFAVQCWYNPATDFHHFVAEGSDGGVGYDPIQGGSRTVREGAIDSKRVYLLV